MWWASVSLDVAEADPRCRDHDGRALHEAAERYRVLDREHRDETATIVRARVDQRARWRLGTHPQQVELLRGQAAGERWLLPFHDVFRECEDVVTALHPCLAMSPYAVAQLLPPGTSFDLVVVQDASSVATAEVVSALSRGRQALVVGDPHGVAPSAFTVAPVGSGGSSAPSPDTQSLFEEAGSLLPGRALDWRHGAVDLRLAAWSGADANLIGAPGSNIEALVRFEHVDGSAHVAAGDDSAIEWTQAEVDRIVALAMDHARSDPERSLGVIALTAALVEQVEATVRRQLHALAMHDRADPALTFFDETRSEPFVIDSIESAGAERDVVILGSGYGRTPHGRVLHRFPSLAGDGAQHRLARVAGLARQKLDLVSSLTPGDLDPDRLRTPGAIALRDLLTKAEAASGRQFDEPATPNSLLDDLAARLGQEGLTVRRRVGLGPYPVELAVGHPSVEGRSLVAVETDGEAYAGLVGTRARDRLRCEQLELLSWWPVRVWTTDLYRDPAREVARIVAAVRAARRSDAPGSEHVRPEADGAPDVDADADGARTDPEAEPVPSGSGSRRRRRRIRRGTAQAVEDTDRAWGEPEDPAEGDRWLEEQRPPHWE
jgi:very-short-patch-repair endonuclease